MPAIPAHSSFDAKKIERNPFERIDAKVLAQEQTVVQAAAGAKEDLASYFQVTAILIDRLAIAIINKKAFAESESFKLTIKDKLVPVKVVKVRDGSVELACGGETVTVPVIRRKPNLMTDEEE